MTGEWRGRRWSPPQMDCSFCGRARFGERPFVGGPGGLYICADCILAAVTAADAGAAVVAGQRLTRVVPAHPGGQAPPDRCDFCGKPSTAISWIVAGAAAVICDECTDLCVEILAEQETAG